MKCLRGLNALGVVVLLCSCSRDPVFGDFDMALAGGFHLRRESTEIVELYHIQNSKNLGVPAKIIQVAWNERVILAKQQQIKSRGKFPGDDYPVPVPGRFDFWIIDLTRTNRAGPLSEQEFRDKLNALNLSNLEMNCTSQPMHGACQQK